MQIEEVFGSRTRVKILKILYQLGGVNITEIARRTGSNHKTALRHLEILEKEGILTHKTFGRIKIYRFNTESEKSRAIQKFIEMWENSERR